MIMEKGLLEKIRDYFNLNPQIGSDSIIYGDYVPETPVNYTITQLPSQNGGIIEKYVGGAAKKEFQFAFMVKQHYSSTNDATKQNFANSKFLEDIQSWVDENNKSGIYPDVDNPIMMETNQPGFLFDLDDNGAYALYQMTGRLIYLQERSI